jgi:hypothetical protein
MDEPRDDIDVWLSERVKPLLPHPDTFERIRKRARRRKLTQVAVAAGGAAVIVAAAVTVPHLVISRLQPAGNPTPIAANSGTPSHSASPTPSPTPSATPSSPTPTSSPTGLPPVPINFAPSSVTFVSTATGWVIGQAGVPGHCANPDPYICTSMAITTNGGASWRGSPAPSTGAPNGAHGVSGVRSLNGTDGWAFGPQLFATHNGGQTWTKIATHGMRVIDLETVGKRAYAVWARCTGTGADFAANCTSFSVYSTRASVDQWAPVSGAVNLSSGTASSAQLVLGATLGYLLAPDGTIYEGPDYKPGLWLPVSSLGSKAQPCAPGAAQADGLPSQGMLAATGAHGLVELCTGPASGSTQTKTLCYSPDGGLSWETAGTAPSAGIATSLSGTPTGAVLVATTAGIDASANAASGHPNSLRWQTVRGASSPGGFSYVGMTTSAQGVAIPADQGVHAVWFTYDGGHRWQASPLRLTG